MCVAYVCRGLNALCPLDVDAGLLASPDWDKPSGARASGHAIVIAYGSAPSEHWPGHCPGHCPDIVLY